jgi:predicted ATPase
LNFESIYVYVYLTPLARKSYRKRFITIFDMLYKTKRANLFLEIVKAKSIYQPPL